VPVWIGAGGGTRTHTTLPSRDFKSLRMFKKPAILLRKSAVRNRVCKRLCKLSSYFDFPFPVAADRDSCNTADSTGWFPNVEARTSAALRPSMTPPASGKELVERKQVLFAHHALPVGDRLGAQSGRRRHDDGNRLQGRRDYTGRLAHGLGVVIAAHMQIVVDLLPIVFKVRCKSHSFLPLALAKGDAGYHSRARCAIQKAVIASAL
jgi:hypothetical protein